MLIAVLSWASLVVTVTIVITVVTAAPLAYLRRAFILVAHNGLVLPGTGP